MIVKKQFCLWTQMLPQIRAMLLSQIAKNSGRISIFPILLQKLGLRSNCPVWLVRSWHVFSQGVSHSPAAVAFGIDRLVQRPALPKSHLTHRNLHRAKTRQEIAKWMEGIEEARRGDLLVRAET